MRRHRAEYKALLEAVEALTEQLRELNKSLAGLTGTVCELNQSLANLPDHRPVVIG